MDAKPSDALVQAPITPTPEISEVRVTGPGFEGSLVVDPAGEGTYSLRDSVNLELTPIFQNRLVSLIGLRLGDEGKGRAVPELITILTEITGSQVPVLLVGKVNGGANSGHSVEVEYRGEKVTLGLNLIPTGVAEKSVPHLALGGGVLADPFKLSAEGSLIESYDLEVWSRLFIDMNTMVADISHRIRDIAREESRMDKRGSTGRGISPGYEDEADFSAIRWDIFRTGDKEEFGRLMRDRLERCCRRVQHEYGMSAERWSEVFEDLTAKEIRANQRAIARGLFSEDDFNFTRFRGDQPFSFNVERMIEEYWAEGCKRAALVTDVGERILDIIDSTNGYVIFEHGQALGLDIRNGTSGSRTASHTGTPEIYESFRVPMSQRIEVIGATKAYETAVGTNHFFPTKMDALEPLAEKLMPMEKGVTTGRQRDVGYFDAVQIGHSLRTHGCDFIVFNKIDELSFEGPWQEGCLKICVGYQTGDGQVIQHVPHTALERQGLTPRYVELPCWQEDLQALPSFNEWPEAARVYLATCIVAAVRIAHRGMKHPPPPPQVLFAGVGPGEGQIVRDVPPYSELLKLAHPF